MKKNIILCSCLLASILPLSIIAQEKVYPFQFTFIDPLSTSGTEAHKRVHNTSIGLLGATSSATTAFSLSSIYNINKNYTEGVQISGIVNLGGEGRKAVQVGGIANLLFSADQGAQIAGIINVAAKGKIPFQMAGIVNQAVESKAQIGGIGNISKSNDGTQIAGIFNVAAKGKIPFQMAGIVNQAVESNTQIAGITNIAQQSKGLQLALINISTKNNRGAMIGLINVADSTETPPIGLFTIVKKNGKQEFELSFSETLHAALTFKLGTRQFYTLFSGGVNFNQATPDYGVGIGLGTQLQFPKRWGGEIELIGYMMTENGSFRIDGTNNLTQLRLTASKQLYRRLSLFAGPTLNLSHSDCKNPISGRKGVTSAPYSIFEKEVGNFTLRGWVGFNIGVRF